MVASSGWDYSTLAQAGRVISGAASDPYELAEVTFLELARLVPTDYFQLGVFEDNQYRTLIYIQDGDRKENQNYALDADQENIVSWVRKTGHPLVVGDFVEEQNDLPARPAYEVEDPPRSAIFLPLTISNNTIGILILQSRKTHAFSSTHLDIVTILGMSVTSALLHLMHHQEIEELTLHMILTQEISRLLISLEPLAKRLDQVVRLISEVMGYRLVQVFEAGEERMQLRSTTGSKPALDADSLIPAVVRECTIDGVMASVAEVEGTSGEVREIHEYAFPLGVVHHLLGTLHLQSDKPLDLDGDEGRILEMLSKQLGFAMLEARNYDDRQEEAWMTTVLLEVAKHAAQPGDVLVALQAVLQLSTLLAGTDWALLLIPDEEGEAIHLAAHAGFRRQQTLDFETLQLTLNDFDIVLPADDSGLPNQIRLPDALVDTLDQTYALCLILTDGKKLLGLLLMQDNPLPGIRPSLLAGIGHQISLRLENASLIEDAALRRSFERELIMARNIQSSFLPDSMPSVPGWEIASAWEVAREVGGDFYDVIPLPPAEHGERWGVVIADVADKGIPAALYMALSRTMLRSVAQTHILPSRTLETVNQQLISDTRSDLFVSVFYAVWEPAIATLTYANAGHLPPFLFRSGKRAELLRDHGMVLGVMSDVSFADQKITLDSGDLLVLYTDGVSEAMNSDDELFGFSRLESLILALKDKNAGSVASAIVERVVNFTGSDEFSDDLTALALRRTP